MTCRNCGAENPGDAAFCGTCGRGMLSAAAVEAAAVETVAEEPRASSGLSWPAQGSPEAPAASAAAGAKPPTLEQTAGTPAMSASPDAGQARTWAEASQFPYRHGNGWYMHRAGVAYRWNEPGSRWEVAALSELPDFMRRPKFASLRGPAIVLYCLFGLLGALTLLAITADINHYATLNRVADGRFVSLNERDDAEALYLAAKFLQSMAVLAIAPFFIWWTRRATCNVPALGAEQPAFSPGWAIGWWFIPIAAWFQPLRVLNQAWRASDAAAVTGGDGHAWRRASLTPLLPIWWIVYQVGSALWSAALSSVDPDGEDVGQQADIMAFVIATDVGMLVMGGLAVAVVVALTRRQDAANALVRGN